MADSVLVTGGAGYIGSHACKALAQAGYMPVTLDNLVHGHRHSVRWGPFVRGDLSDVDLVRRVLREYRIGSVLHFAGYAYVGESMRDPGKYFANNVGNTVALLNAMQGEGANRIVFSSTCATYGMPRALPIDENHPQLPMSPYGESKLVAERMLEWFAVAHGLRYAALRYFNAAGADPDGELGEEHDPETHLIPLIIGAAQGQQPPVAVFGTDYPTRDGTAVRDYVHVTDLAAAHVLALQKLQEGVKSIRINLGTGQGHSVREVIGMVEAVGRRPVPTRDAARRPGDPPELVAAAGRAEAVLGWSPRYSNLHDIVATAWLWHASRASGRHVAAAD